MFFCLCGIMTLMDKIKIVCLIIAINIALSVPFFAEAEEIREITFPVDREWKYNFSDTFGAARAAGRTHEGTDIIVDQMTPLLAAVNGRVTFLTETEKPWGMAIYIEDAAGYSYRYLHVNNDTPGTDDGKAILAYAFARGISRGTNVSAGQVIAFAGDSGNAENVTHHLHFEIWTPAREAINPYPSLMAAIGQPLPQENEVITPAPGGYQFTRDLELGDTGEDVRQLQKYLNQHGYLVATSGAGSPSNETTYFGPATKAALIKFQQANNLPTIGYFGSLTRAVFNQTTIPENENTPIAVTAGWLVKDKLSARVYYVAPNMELQWIVSEEAAIRHFGPDWYLQIREFPDLNNLGLRYGDYLL